MHACIHTYMHTYVRVCVRTCVRAYVRTYVHTYGDTIIQLCTYVRTQIHTCIHTLTMKCLWSMRHNNDYKTTLSHRADSAADIAISLVIFGNYLVYCSYYHWHYELPVKCKQKTKDRVGNIGDIGIFHKYEFSVCLQSGND